MIPRLYGSYPMRSLRRGGQRTVLAVFCIAVGVMAVVALRLVGTMIGDSVTGNVRSVLGGDLSVQALGVPLQAADLARIDALQQRGLVTRYVALGTDRGTVRRPNGRIAGVLVYVVDDPAHFPLVEDGGLLRPANVSLGSLVAPRASIVLSDLVAGEVGADVGATVHLNVSRGGGIDVRVAGVVANRPTAGGATLAYVSRATYAAVATVPEQYGLVDLLTPDAAAADAAARALRTAFPTATVQTVQDALDEDRTISDDLSRFLTIVGLLALLIGGVGIGNTMQVSLRRRVLEIAVLKTAGFRRRDLYALFAVEAVLLGATGGVVGAAAGTGISAVVRVLVERVFLLHVSFRVDPAVVAAGVAVGVATALIFGLVPIVRAAGVRPLAVLRGDDAAASPASRVQVAGLYALLVALFSTLSLGLIGSVTWTVVAVLGTLATIALLAGVFTVLVGVVARLPVPDRPRLDFIALVTGVVAACALLAWRGPRAVGTVLLVAALSGYLVAVMPRRARTALLLGLRAIRRTRGRTVATLVALFVGVSTIGLVVVLGQDIRAKIDDSLATLSDVNVFGIANGADAAPLVAVTASLPGVSDRTVTHDVGTVPVTVRGVPVAELRASAATRGSAEAQQFRFAGLSGLEGYDLGAGQRPRVLVVGGRGLDAGDAGSGNALVRSDLANSPIGLHLGDTVEVQGPEAGRTATLHVVGFYAPVRLTGSGIRVAIVFQPVLVDRSVVDALGGGAVQTVVALKLDLAAKDAALRRLEGAVPNAVVFDLTDYAALITDFLGNLVVLLLAIASLALFAGVVIIGNTVALAMVERRREIGVLKAVGYSSRSVLAHVMVENGIVGGLGALTGMAAVTLVTWLLGRFLLGSDLAVSTPVVAVIVVGTVALVAATAALVAWQAVRVRPLEVLRYQ